MLCEEECKCSGVCNAKGLKKIPQCDCIMKSQCSKTQCKQRAGGGKPDMCLPAVDRRKRKSVETPTKKAKGKAKVSKTIYRSNNSDQSDSTDQSDRHSEPEDNTSLTCDNHSLSKYKMPDTNLTSDEYVPVLKDFWTSVSPPVKKEEMLGKSFVAVYNTGSENVMCVGRAMKRFLEEKDGPVNNIQLNCLKPRVGSSLVLEAYPEGSPDLYMFQLQNVIAGPLSFTITRKRRT